MARLPPCQIAMLPTRRVFPCRVGVWIGSEIDFVVAIDRFGRIAHGRFRAAQEVDLLGDQLAEIVGASGAVPNNRH